MVRALAEAVRWRIVEALASEQLCVCHLVEDLGIDQPSVSHHLRVLRDAGLVEGKRYRYWTYRRLRPVALPPPSGLAPSQPTPAPPAVRAAEATSVSTTAPTADW